MPIKWMDECESKNYDGAQSFLSLIMEEKDAASVVENFKQAKITKFKAKDILRASGLKRLNEDNEHVSDDIKKIKNQKELSPILLMRDKEHGKVVVADGYHRLSAVHVYNEDEWIYCKIV